MAKKSAIENNNKKRRLVQSKAKTRAAVKLELHKKDLATNSHKLTRISFLLKIRVNS